MDKLILGEGVERAMDSAVTKLNNNVLVVGGTGAGKTMSVVEPQLLYTNERSIVCVVSKRALVEKYTEMFKKRGYDTLDMNLVNPELSNVGYNPLQYLESNIDIYNFAYALAAMKEAEQQRPNDAYWDYAATSFIGALIALVHENRSEQPDFITWDERMGPSFADVLKLFKKMVVKYDAKELTTTSLDRYFEKSKWDNRDSYASYLFSSVQNLPARTMSCVYTQVSTILNKFSPELEKLMDHERVIDFRQLGNKKTVLFVTVDPVAPGQNLYLNLLYTDLFRSLCRYAQTLPDGRLPIPVHVICDDFGCCRIPAFEKQISIFRAAGISTSLLCQSEAQLTAIYNESNATTIINNCDTYVFMGGMDLQTAKNISLRLNKPLEDVLYLPLNKVIVFQRGQKPVITERYRILEDKLYMKNQSEVTRWQKHAGQQEKEDKEDGRFENLQCEKC